MKINLHIERVIFEGVPFDIHAKAQLKFALERELARVFRGGFNREIRRGRAFDRVRGGTVTLGREISVAGLSSAVASAVHHSIGADDAPVPRHDAQSARAPERRRRR